MIASDTVKNYIEGSIKDSESCNYTVQIRKGRIIKIIHSQVLQEEHMRWDDEQ